MADFEALTESSSLAPTFAFIALETNLQSFASKAREEQLMQYNIDTSLVVKKFRFSGGVVSTLSDYDTLLKDFFASSECMAHLQVSGNVSMPVEYLATNLGTSVMSMDFFDRLEDANIVGSGGRLLGCYDEVFDGVTVSDKLREMFLNEESENAAVYSECEKKEIIYKLLRLFAVGGSMCQPDHAIERYLEITKDAYKELITVYKDAKTDEVKVAGQVFQIEKVNGLHLWSAAGDSPHHVFIVIADDMMKCVTVVKYTFKSSW